MSLVRPKLEYARAAWNPHTVKDVRRVEQVQRNATRFVCGVYQRGISVSGLMNSLGWQNLEQRRRMATVQNSIALSMVNWACAYKSAFSNILRTIRKHFLDDLIDVFKT